MAKNLPSKIRHKGHIYVRADLHTADLGNFLSMQKNDILRLMKAIEEGNLSKEQMLEKLSELGLTAKGLTEQLQQVPGVSF